MLEADLRNLVRIKNLTEAVIEATFQSSTHTVDAMVQQTSNVNGEEIMMKIAPIPAYLVWDGFDKDLDAAVVREAHGLSS